MNRHSFTLFIALLCGAIFCCPVHSPAQGLRVQHLGGGHAIVRIAEPHHTLLLPIQESAPEARVDVLLHHHLLRTLDVRLARTHTDHYVPFCLDTLQLSALSLVTHGLEPDALCWSQMRLTNQPFVPRQEFFRPAFHFTPPYGWMNDPNGMVYHQGTYHLFYQYNPYGSQWGNMHWGHATSPDMMHWTHQPVAIAPDALGTIFSGSAVVDEHNTAGFGPGAIVAFYTSAGQRQAQSMAYSTDGGHTFHKYALNPILTSDAHHDFRDPRVIFHQPTRQWVMVVAAGQELRFYSSSNLKEWHFESAFGAGHGEHGGVWECPDLFQLPIEGTQDQKWTLVCNINPGGPQGGSATQYFVGDFDGHRFINQDSTLRLWMDWGKDHYATVSFSHDPQGHTHVMAWMSNWEYAAQVPTTQFRSACSLPRRLSLYRTPEGHCRLKVRPVPQVEALRRAPKKERFAIDSLHTIALPPSGLCDLQIEWQPRQAHTLGLRLHNAKGEQVDVAIDLYKQQMSVDRTRSGLTHFSPTFATRTTAPLPAPLPKHRSPLTLRLIIDRSSIEAFALDGQVSLTNLVFPTQPFTHATFYAHPSPCRASLTCYEMHSAHGE